MCERTGSRGREGLELELTTDAPAFFVTLGLGGPFIYSDNAITLLPGRSVRIKTLRRIDGQALVQDPSAAVPKIEHLGG